MLQSSTGIVLRVRPLTETSLIVHWLSRDYGRISSVAKGALRPKSPIRGKVDLFYQAEFSFRRSRTSELHPLSEVMLLETHTALRQDIGLLNQASYAVELLELTTETETPIPAIYDIIIGYVTHLCRCSAARGRNVLTLELKLLAEAGLMPEFDTAHLGHGAKEAAALLSAAGWEGIDRLELSQDAARELAAFLWLAWQPIWPRAPRTRASALGLRARERPFLRED